MSLPKFGGVPSLLNDVLKEMKNLQKYNFDFIEIWFQEPYGTPELLLKKQKEIKEFVHENNLFLLAHPPHWAEIASLHKGIRKAWVNEYKEIIDASQKLEIQKLVVHPHIKKIVKTGKPFEKEMLENNVETLTEITDYANGYGITILLENVPRKENILNFNDFKYLVDHVKDIKVNVDVGHAFIYYGMENVFKYLEGFKKKLDHLHFHDNKGDEDEHLPIGVGSIDYKAVVEYLKKIRYDKTITFEIFCKDKDYLGLSVEKIKKIWK